MGGKNIKREFQQSLSRIDLIVRRAAEQLCECPLLVVSHELGCDVKLVAAVNDGEARSIATTKLRVHHLLIAPSDLDLVLNSALKGLKASPKVVHHVVHVRQT